MISINRPLSIRVIELFPVEAFAVTWTAADPDEARAVTLTAVDSDEAPAVIVIAVDPEEVLAVSWAAVEVVGAFEYSTMKVVAVIWTIGNPEQGIDSLKVNESSKVEFALLKIDTLATLKLLPVEHGA